MVYERLHLDISNQWGCKGEAIVLMDVSDSHKEIIVCQNWNLLLSNCPTGRELIYIINTTIQLLSWKNTLKYSNMNVAINIRIRIIKNI